MTDVAQDMVRYANEALSQIEVDMAMLYFGSHKIAVNSISIDDRFPSLLICVTANGEELAVDPAAILAIMPETPT